MPDEWVDIDDFAVGETLRAADLNQMLANMRFLAFPPMIAVRLQTAQTVASASDTAIVWTQAVWDSFGDMWDAGSPSKIVIQREGLYEIHCSTLWDGSNDGSKRAIFLHVNGTVRRRGVQLSAENPSEIQLTGLTTLGVGDDIEFQVRQTSGSDQDLQPIRTVCTVKWSSQLPLTTEA